MAVHSASVPDASSLFGSFDVQVERGRKLRACKYLSRSDPVTVRPPLADSECCSDGKTNASPRKSGGLIDNYYVLLRRCVSAANKRKFENLINAVVQVPQ